MADDRDPLDEDTPADEETQGYGDGDWYIPTPEEIESSDAPRVFDRSGQEEVSEESTGFFGRFKMRRRRGVGKRRKYVSPETRADTGGSDGDEPPDSSSVVAALGDEPLGRDDGGAEVEVPVDAEPQLGSGLEEDGPDETEQTVDTREDRQEYESKQPEDKGSEPEQPPAAARRV